MHFYYFTTFPLKVHGFLFKQKNKKQNLNPLNQRSSLSGLSKTKVVQKKKLKNNKFMAAQKDKQKHGWFKTKRLVIT